ncbi:MAG: carboxymuconolactone decarboxylase family protein [Alphaproteobacteria bacterium]|nr:carboxymuconolactone decarboxylase family protein [Alphaproteobacteria bacterium]
MSVESLKTALPETAKDIRINLSKVLSEEGAPGLTQKQILGTALASAHATREAQVINAITEEAAAVLTAEEIAASKAAATIMAMNNVYYRFIHLAADDEIKKMSANLRMQIIANPGVPKVDFEIMCLAVSAINGCGMCMESHVHEVEKGGVSKQGAQSAIRIAAVINAAAQGVVSV